MILHPGEHGIASEPVEGVAGPSVSRGRLYLTNLRLVFEGMVPEQVPGGGYELLGPSTTWVPRTLLDLPLVHITNIVGVPGSNNRHTLRVEAGPYAYSFLTPRAHEWVQTIYLAREKAPAPISPGAAMQAPVVVHVQQTPAQPSVFLHCKHCGSLCAAGSVHCISCGAAL